MKDADEELEWGSAAGNSVQESSEKETTPLLPSKPETPVALPTIVSNGYCSDIPPHCTTNAGRTDKSGSSTSSALTQNMCSSSNNCSSSGHNTQQSSTQSPNKIPGVVGGACYTTLGSGCNPTLMEAVEDTHSDFDPTFIEEFGSSDNISGWNFCEDHTLPSTAQAPYKPFVLSSKDLPKGDKSSSNSLSCLAEVEESDSVFDETSLGQSSPPPTNQQRTRSAVTSGFCSQSDVPLDQVSSGNIAMTPFKDACQRDFTFEVERNSNPFIPTSPQWDTMGASGYVVPSLLKPQKISSDTKLPSKSDGYINTEGISLEHISNHLN